MIERNIRNGYERASFCLFVNYNAQPVSIPISVSLTFLRNFSPWKIYRPKILEKKIALCILFQYQKNFRRFVSNIKLQFSQPIWPISVCVENKIVYRAIIHYQNYAPRYLTNLYQRSNNRPLR